MRFLLIIFFLYSLIYAKTDELHVTSKLFRLYRKEFKAVFIGDVVATRNKSIVKADKITIFLNRKNQPIKYIGKGHVFFHGIDKIRNSVYEGHGNEVIYNIIAKTYTFKGNAVIKDLTYNRKLVGDVIHYNENSAIMRVNGYKKKYVKMMFDLNKIGTNKKSKKNKKNKKSKK